MFIFQSIEHDPNAHFDVQLRSFVYKVTNVISSKSATFSALAAVTEVVVETSHPADDNRGTVNKEFVHYVSVSCSIYDSGECSNIFWKQNPKN